MGTTYLITEAREQTEEEKEEGIVNLMYGFNKYKNESPPVGCLRMLIIDVEEETVDCLVKAYEDNDNITWSTILRDTLDSTLHTINMDHIPIPRGL